MNSTGNQKEPKKLGQVITRSSPHTRFWFEAIERINNTAFKNSRGRTPSLKNWSLTLENMRNLVSKLFKKGFKYVVARNFNQDPLENFFGKVRQNNGDYKTQDPASFRAAFKTLTVISFSGVHSPGGNCEDDRSLCLNSLKEFVMNQGTEQFRAEPNFTLSFDTESFNFKVITDSLVKDKDENIAGWMGRIILRKIGKYPTCKKELLGKPADDEHELIKARDYGGNRQAYPVGSFTCFFL